MRRRPLQGDLVKMRTHKKLSMATLFLLIVLSSALGVMVKKGDPVGGVSLSTVVSILFLLVAAHVRIPSVSLLNAEEIVLAILYGWLDSAAFWTIVWLLFDYLTPERAEKVAANMFFVCFALAFAWACVDVEMRAHGVENWVEKDPK